jgi:hypothetical protein
MLIVDNIGVAVVASIAKATVEAPSTADLAGTFGGTVNPAPVDGRFWDVATVDEIDTSRDNRHSMPLQVRTIQTTSACLVYLQKRKVGAHCLGSETCCRRTG